MGFWDEDLDGLRDRLRNCGFNPQTLTSKAVPTDVVITSSRLVKAASELKLFMAAAKPPGRASLLNKDLGPVWGKLKDVDGALADLQSCASQWMDAASTEIFQMLINSMQEQKSESSGSVFLATLTPMITTAEVVKAKMLVLDFDTNVVKTIAEAKGKAFDVADALLKFVRSDRSKALVEAITAHDSAAAEAKRACPTFATMASGHEDWREHAADILKAKELMKACGAIQSACRRVKPNEDRQSLVREAASKFPDKVPQELLAWVNSFL